MAKMSIRATVRRCSGICLLGVISGLLLVSCGGDEGQPYKPPANRPPVISRVYHDPARVLRNHEVSAIAVTSDPENDRLGHIWTANRGLFPFGYGQRTVPWLSPEEHGPSSLYLAVTDGEFTVRDSIVIVTADLDPPVSIRFAAGSSIADIAWDGSPDEGIDHWYGYEIFMALSPISSIPVEDLGRHRLAFLSGLTREFRKGGLVRGTLYYFAVGSVRGWGEWIEDEQRWSTEERSRPGPEVVLSPRPEWPAQMGEFAHPGGSIALDMSAGTVRPLNVNDPSGLADRDLYIGTSESMDGPGLLRLKSISRLANRNEGWSGRVVQFKFLGTDWTVSTTTDVGWSEQTSIEVGGVYAALLPEGNYAKIQITSVIGSYPYRQIQLRWAYQTIPGFPVF